MIYNCIAVESDKYPLRYIGFHNLMLRKIALCSLLKAHQWTGKPLATSKVIPLGIRHIPKYNYITDLSAFFRWLLMVLFAHILIKMRLLI